MSEKGRDEIRAERVIIYADEVIVIEGKGKRQRYIDKNVGGEAERKKEHRKEHKSDDDRMGEEEDFRKRRFFPW